MKDEFQDEAIAKLSRERNEASIKARAHKPTSVSAKAYFLLGGASGAMAQRIKPDA